MKVTLLITTYNRPEYLKRCLASVKRAGIKNIVIVDDRSTDEETIKIVKQYSYTTKSKRAGICDSLLIGIEYAFTLGADIVINLDADAIIRNDFLERMMELHYAFPDDIITGFHSTTKNKDGSERHKITEQLNYITKDIVNIGFRPDYSEENMMFVDVDEKIRFNKCVRKQSVGGINMLWTRANWDKMKPVIENAQKNNLNWDHRVSLNSNGIICAVPSLVQHIGIESSMNHTEAPDVADDFKILNLPDVTLVCVDDNYEQGLSAMLKCSKDIQFGDMKLFSSSMTARLGIAEVIDKLGSKEAYSKFILKELHKYIDTKYCLIVQHDGFVRNPEAWNNEFMQYDYIGATWWYKDGKNVGNGGFSLRSKKLLELCANLPTTATHPEDHIICRDMRPYLESKGIKFAPETLANQFSFEGYNQPGTYTNQFGFHGNRAFRRPPDPKKTGFIINQFLGLGDILYLVPMIRHWQSLGHDVVWPIADEYIELKRHFPDIQFCKKSDWPKVRYDYPKEYMHQWQYGLYQVKPLRWNMTRNLSEAMTSKYTMYGLNPEMWRELFWQRDMQREERLKEILQANGEYSLYFQEFGNITDGGSSFRVLPIDDRYKRIYSCRMQGFTMLDLAMVIENATVIHAVSSSCIYLFELLNLKAKEIHLYSRKLGERDFEMVKPILTKFYTLHI